MAVSAAVISGIARKRVWGSDAVTVYRLTFSGNYATGGEAITAATFGLRKIRQVIPQGAVAMASALSTGIAIGWDAANSKLVFFESGASGAALIEKTNSEAYPTGCFIDVTVVGR